MMGMTPTAAPNVVPFQAPKMVLDAIDGGEMLAHITELASDEYGGRAPGSEGEELSVAYITEQFKNLGLQPGNPDGTYVQDVPLAGIKATPTLRVNVGGQETSLSYPGDFVATSSRLVPEIKVTDSEIVFVGYGTVAPEYGWNDYKGVDVTGKTLLMLCGDPVVPDAADPSKVDESLFKGRALTYYGRWTYKYEIAAKMGAAAAVLIHETGPAGYPYSVVESSWTREVFELDAEDKHLGAVPVRSWVSREVGQKLLADGGQDFDALKRAALTKDFRPVPLGVKASFEIKSELRSFESRNVLARLDGRDASLRDEWVIYSAHWDHLGRKDEPGQEPRIYHGAVDNASGVALVLAVAKAFTQLPVPPARSILFMAPTAEESGLLGAKHYAEHPLYPLEKTLADINIDGVNVWGATSDIENISSGHSDLDEILQTVAAAQGRRVVPDTRPEKGYFYRADHFEFAKRGVPCLYPSSGKEVIGQPPGFGHGKSDEYVARHYHQPSDNLDPSWNLSGAVQDAQLLFEIGLQIANGEDYPQWVPGGEFKAVRDEMLARAGG